jgi:CHAD domain-containing protein
VTDRPPIAPADPLTAFEAAVRVVDEQLRELKRHGRKLRKRMDGAAVHEMRVATRRLRTAFRALQQEVRAPHGLRERLGWFAGKLGAVRDDDVILTLLRVPKLPGGDAAERGRLTRLVRRLAARQEKHGRRLVRAMARGRYRRMLGQLEGFAAAAAARHDGAMASRVLAEVCERLGEAILRSPGMTAEAPEAEALHALRIEFKRLRYALDFHAAACGLAYDVERRLAREMQDVLGEVHDRDLLRGWLAGGEGMFRGPWPALEARLAAERARALRRFLRLRRAWLSLTREEPAVAPLEPPRFVNLEVQPVTLRLVRGAKRVASSSVG